MLIEWIKETDNRYTATWRGSFLVLKYFNRCWRVIVRHIADGHTCCPPNRWQDLTTAKQDIDVKALRAVMTYATPVAHQKSLPVRIIHGSHGGGKANQARKQVAAARAAGLAVVEVRTSPNGRHPSLGAVRVKEVKNG